MPEPPQPFRDLDWSSERARSLADGAVGIWGELLERLPSLPVDPGLTRAQVAEAVPVEIPEEPLSERELLERLRRLALDLSMYPGHPGFMAYVSGAGTVPGAVGDLVAAAINQNSGGWLLSPGASELEIGLTRWFARLFGLPQGGGGLIVSGGAMANLIGLKLARDRGGGLEVRERGVGELPALAVYASEEAHAVVERGADLLGIGSGAIRKLPTDVRFRLRLDALEEAIERDRSTGVRPIAVVATAGTVATGAVDPLSGVAELCQRHGLWLHVDGAYGGPAVLADDMRPQLAGIERADSIAFDPHKWLYTPLSGGCVLVRDLALLADSFAVEAGYIRQDREAVERGLDLGQLGPQFSRGFHALKVWLSLLAHGRAAYAQRISHDAALARYLGSLVEEREDFELAAPVGLSICCFRYVPPGLPAGPEREAYLDRLNERIVTEAQQGGSVFFSNAVLRGRYVLRTCIVNFRTEAPDVERVLEVAAEIGERVDRAERPR